MMKKPRLRQYFALHSNVIVANDDVHVKVLEPFEIEVGCMLRDSSGNNIFELCVSFKHGKSFMNAFGLGSVEEIKGITKEDLIRVWKCQMIEEMTK
ncbi:MAG TPA: hypothetical protein VK541_11550 [Pedobacter sp.]|uniref:hypothetical protein n=1 Tax=Pedobacter sp. TaxID=1411316 RepID=UPI002B7CF8E0|nr:hypothetical protein [Pedobacter sp.]HMI03111.1 hypothetical protein [Pedobacter sp.]